MTTHHHDSHEANASSGWLAANMMTMLMFLAVLAVLIIGAIYLFRAMDDDGDGGLDVDVDTGGGAGGAGAGGNESGGGSGTTNWQAPDGTTFTIAAA